ncbi:hypothetical protein EHI8A_002110 [Entamoeba histolytica HM-1:IMSS-B]|uniref:Uncharacterized protein n=6 Tax=Entamoeba histolytica TaxID=5759 RepID=C4LXH3_ENTH1|nr:hypothetical protein EHI_131050 [Entamoeba histolytica HM-1:IMSS]EMD43156.1 Hypothetical protein EHI5A_014060 [Entamoeba histolytica KU27]EMH73033.1 hypothetical protein EHI8A_002110 [Entamoeba histolytica HM-1:IMSS-B]EMS15419.1 hypothetical protein KM1_014720 [Entamoeba histolytica HM-3:IMSS]ENY60760.1 hypothetical protein EHI7A_003890 [Entamoeba histolytica HM-1:IMSS-A]BAN39407.1 hypothetical protein [Entamoeba histolytica]|eukprot:XP_655517.1 hypothetical protein EHI_131050 [Entamoeba histolytica HM-1:IMSS]
MFKGCCIAGCKNQGEFPLSKIQGTVKIKKELINTIPREWKICKNDFDNMLKQMECCIEHCDKMACPLEVSPSKLSQVNLKNDCCHHQLCTFHATKYSDIITPTPIKREVQTTDVQLPQQKKQAEDEDTITESNQHNSDTDTSTETRDDGDNNPTTGEEKNEKIKNEKSITVPAEPNQSTFMETEKNNNYGKETSLRREGGEEQKTEASKIYPQESKEENKTLVEGSIVNDENKIKEDIVGASCEDIKNSEKPQINLEAHEEEEVNKEEHQCCIDNCNAIVENEIPILQPLHVYVCQNHLDEIIKLWRVSLLQHQIVLNDECLELLKKGTGENIYNPLYNYTNPMQNDVKCALCCGFYKKEETYNCSFCPFTFCVECYKRLCLTLGTPQQFISNKARWKCFVCSCCEPAAMNRNVFIKKQLELLIPIIEARISDGCVIGKSADELKEFVDSIK